MDVKKTPDGPRLPVINRRTTPIDAQVPLGFDEYIPVGVYASDSRVGIMRLSEQPLVGNAGTDMTVIRASNNIALQATTVFPPPVGRYYLNKQHGCIYIHKEYIGEGLIVKYLGIGTIVVAEDINWLFEHTYANSQPYDLLGIMIKANTAVNVLKRVVSAIYLVQPDGSLLFNPAQITATVYNISDAATVYTTLKNTSAVDAVVRVKALPFSKPYN